MAEVHKERGFSSQEIKSRHAFADANVPMARGLVDREVPDDAIAPFKKSLHEWYDKIDALDESQKEGLRQFLLEKSSKPAERN